MLSNRPGSIYRIYGKNAKTSEELCLRSINLIEKSSTATLTTIPTEVNGASWEYSIRYLQPMMKKLHGVRALHRSRGWLYTTEVEDDNRKFRSFSCAALLDYFLHYGKHNTPNPVRGKPLYSLDSYFHNFPRWEVNDTKSRSAICTQIRNKSLYQEVKLS